MASSLMFNKRGRSVDDFVVDRTGRQALAIRAYLRDPDKAHQSIYGRNVKAVRETKISCAGGVYNWIGERT